MLLNWIVLSNFSGTSPSSEEESMGGCYGEEKEGEGRGGEGRGGEGRGGEGRGGEEGHTQLAAVGLL